MKDPASIAEKAISFCKGDEAEAIVIKENSALTRFSQNRIHQNMATESIQLLIRVITEGCQGSYTTNRLDEDGMKHAADKAMEIAGSLPPEDSFPGLPSGYKSIKHESVAPATRQCTPSRRGAIVRQIIDIAEKKKVEASGAVAVETTNLAIVNTNGIHAVHHGTSAELNLAPSREPLSGYAYWIGKDIDDMPFVDFSHEAMDKAAFEGEPVNLDAGEYTVILSPYAMGNLVRYLAYTSFGARQYLEGRSFMSQMRGKKVTSERINISDNGLNPDGLPRAFDFEGVPKQKVWFIRNGIATDVVHDSVTAAKSGEKNTGHALPSPNTEGPMPLNLFMEPGASSEEEMISQVKKGLFITKFHYMNILEPVATIMTGMTKDGTFLIEDGKITAPVRNMRFTQNILEALEGTISLSQNRRLYGSSSATVMAPSALLERFRFTGVSSM